MSKKSEMKFFVRPIFDYEAPKWEYVMSHNHYLGYYGFLGESIRYIAISGDQWIALTAFSSAALKLKARDSWIGWEGEEKDKRLKYVVNNSRFLILDGGEKNLASRILSMNIKRLSSDWERKYNHPVILVETFVDSNKYVGTCYRASNWVEVGETRGYKKTHNGYIYHGEKRRIFLIPIIRMAREMLRNPWPNPYFRETPWRKSMTDIWELPIDGEFGLLAMLKTIKDPRSRHGIRHKSYGLLALCIIAVLSGAKQFKSIAIFGKNLSEKLLKRIKLRSAPDASTVSRFMNRLDAESIDSKITEWLLSLDNLYGKAIAIDGKTLRGSHDKCKSAIKLLSAVIHGEGVVVAQKEIKATTNEIPELRELIKPINIEGSVVTADAMHCQKETARFIVEDKKADYLLTAKDNQREIKDAILNLLSEDFSPSAHRI